MEGSVLYEGKSKTVVETGNPDTCVIRYRDTATAFNGVKREELEDKGRINAEISLLLFRYLEKNGIETHLIEPAGETAVLAYRAAIIPVEVIIRNAAAGSFCKRYGVPEGAELKNTVVEFSYKSDELGDPLINDSHITALGLATAEELAFLSERALKVNELLSGLFKKAGMFLVDFKLEFGRFKDKILLCDEFTPDACRLWDIQSGEKMDKDRFRRDLGGVMDAYREVLARLKGALN